MARSCAHRDQTRQGSNHFIDQIKCRGCGELLYKYNFAKVNDQMLLQCVRSREYFDRLERSPGTLRGHPTGPSDSTQDEVSATTWPSPPPPPGAPGATRTPLPARLSAEVIRQLTDAEVQQVIEEHSRLAREILQKKGPIDMPTSSASQQEPDTRARPGNRKDVGQQPPPESVPVPGGFHVV